MSTTDQQDAVPMMVRGTLITLRRRCGKVNCRCASGEPHESPALTVSVSGRSVTISLRPGEVSAVTQALARYQAARAELDEAANQGVAALRRRRRR